MKTVEGLIAEWDAIARSDVKSQARFAAVHMGLLLACADLLKRIQQGARLEGDSFCVSPACLEEIRIAIGNLEAGADDALG